MALVSPSSGLRRSLRFGDLLAIGLNATVGSGVFLLPDDLFRQMGVWSPFAFALCALGLWPVAWCFADAARRTSHTGGPYAYAREELGSAVGYAVGWMCFANAVFSFAAVASAAAAYAGRLVPELGTASGARGFAVSSVALFGTLNYFGARPGAWAIRVLTFGKFAVLLLLASVLVPAFDLEGAAVVAARAPSVRGTAAALFMALFALQGFEVVGVPAGEAQAPERKVPSAVFGTLGAASALYVLVQTLLVFGFDGLGKASDAPLADAALAWSPAFGIVVGVGALVSTLGFVSGSALGTPRYLYAMASGGQLPAFLGRLHPLFGTPSAAIVVTSVAAAVLVLPLDYRTLIGMSNVAVAVQYAATCGAVLRRDLRERTSRVSSPSARRVVVSVLGLAVSVAICFAATREELLFAAGALGVGVFLRALPHRARVG